MIALAQCAREAGACALDPGLADLDANGFLLFSDAALLAQHVAGSSPAWQLPCPHRPEATPPSAPQP